MHHEPFAMARKTTARKQAEKAHTRITVTLEPDAHEKVVCAARDNHVSASWVVREAVRKYFEEASRQKSINQ